jgi:hypothetical protein
MTLHKHLLKKNATAIPSNRSSALFDGVRIIPKGQILSSQLSLQRSRQRSRQRSLQNDFWPLRGPHTADNSIANHVKPTPSVPVFFRGRALPLDNSSQPFFSTLPLGSDSQRLTAMTSDMSSLFRECPILKPEISRYVVISPVMSERLGALSGTTTAMGGCYIHRTTSSHRKQLWR